MHLEILAYPFIFLGLYFEVFMLLTFLSTPAKERRNRLAVTDATPRVAIIVPCWNEESTIDGTVKSLLALDYPKEKLGIILVNDGSTDNTKAVMDSYLGNPQITVIHKENGGKHTAINRGIECAQGYEFVGCLDADSFVEPDALREMMSAFDDPKVGASTPAMSVWQPRTILERMQNAEYVFGISARHILSAVNGIYVTPGPFSVYRKSVIDEIGGFRHAHQAEDMEMALRLQRAGYEIENSPRARVYSKVPRTVPKLIKQRTRWTTGFLRNVMGEYRDLVGNHTYGILGLLVLPLGFVTIVGSVSLFFLALVQSGTDLYHAFAVMHGVPLEYILTPHFTADWFYSPISFMTVIGVVALIISTTFVLIGRNISKTHIDLTSSILGYALLYGLIAPFWLIRSIADVATGTKRSWR